MSQNMPGKLANNVIWSGIGFSINKGSLFYAIILSSHYLTTPDYVHYSLFLLSVNIFSGIVGGSLSLMANRYAYKTSLVFGLWSTITLFSFASALVYFGYATISGGNVGQFAGLYGMEALYVFGTTYLTSMNGIYYGQNRFKEYALINTAIGLGTIALITPILLKGDYFWFLAGSSVPLLLFLVASSAEFIAKSQRSLFSWKWIKNGLRKVFFPNLLSGILFQPAILFSAEWVLKYSAERDLIAFSVANQFRMILTSFSLILGSVLISRLLLSKDRASANKRNIEISYYPILLLASLSVICMKILFLLFDKMDYEAFSMNTVILSGVVIISAVNSAISRNFVIDEKGRIGVWNNLTWLLAFVGLNLLLIPVWGSVGASASFLLASLFQFLVWLPYCLKHSYFSLSFFNRAFFLSGFLFLLILLSELYLKQPFLSIPLFILLVLVIFKFSGLQLNFKRK